MIHHALIILILDYSGLESQIYYLTVPVVLIHLNPLGAPASIQDYAFAMIDANNLRSRTNMSFTISLPLMHAIYLLTWWSMPSFPRIYPSISETPEHQLPTDITLLPSSPPTKSNRIKSSRRCDEAEAAPQPRTNTKLDSVEAGGCHHRL